jgi:phosphoribosylformylglycinamidine cyclo-ligase
LHTNGYSLARKIFFEVAKLGADDRVPQLGTTVGQALLAEHRCYLAQLAQPVEEGYLHALAHITGGGLTDNLPRVLPDGTSARIDRTSWQLPPVFSYMQQQGRVAGDEIVRTFNMGIGMVAIVAPADAERLETHLDSLGETHHRIGEVVEAPGGVMYD